MERRTLLAADFFLSYFVRFLVPPHTRPEFARYSILCTTHTYGRSTQKAPAGPSHILCLNIKYERWRLSGERCTFFIFHKMPYEIDSVCKSNVFRPHATIESRGCTIFLQLTQASGGERWRRHDPMKWRTKYYINKWVTGKELSQNANRTMQPSGRGNVRHMASMDGPTVQFEHSTKLNTLCTYRFLLFFAKAAIYLSGRRECVTHSGQNIIQYWKCTHIIPWILNDL